MFWANSGFVVDMSMAYEYKMRDGIQEKLIKNVHKCCGGITAVH